MRATTKLEVTREMRITVTLDMSVDEMDAILAATQTIDRWPMFSLKNALRQSLALARQAYSSEQHSE